MGGHLDIENLKRAVSTSTVETIFMNLAFVLMMPSGDPAYHTIKHTYIPSCKERCWQNCSIRALGGWNQTLDWRTLTTAPP